MLDCLAAMAATGCAASSTLGSVHRPIFALSTFPLHRVGLSPAFFQQKQRHFHRPSTRCMAPEDEKMTRRSPLNFPIEWERPRPGRRPDIFPQFSPMKTPLPQPLPADPPEEDEEEEEKKEEEEPDKEKPEKKPEET